MLAGDSGSIFRLYIADLERLKSQLAVLRQGKNRKAKSVAGGSERASSGPVPVPPKSTLGTFFSLKAAT